MKFYGKITSHDIKTKGELTKLITKIIFTEEDKRRLKTLSIEAGVKGMDLTFRQITFPKLVDDGYSIADFLTMLDDIPEISDEVYEFSKTIPAWSPFDEALETMGKYIELIDLEQDSPGADKVREMVSKFMKDIRESSDLKINPS